MEFINEQKYLSVACSSDGQTWIANVFVGVDEKGHIYFVSPEDNKHSSFIRKNPHIALSSVWFDRNNHKNRKGIQGTGICRLAKNDEEIRIGVRLHNKNFPEFKEKITEEWIRTNEWKSRVWIIEPNYIKYWDDELYGENESKEFHFDS